MRRKIFLIMLALLLLVPSMVMANGSFELIGVTENPEYLDKNEDEIVPYETYKPTNIYDFTYNNKYNFSGEAYRQDLYTNYLFTGKTMYSVVVTNRNPNNLLHVAAYKKQSLFDEKLQEIDITTSGSFVFYADKSDKVYLRFTAPCDFSGNIY